MVKTKAWYTSKIVWSGVLVTLIGVLEVLQVWLDAGDYSYGGVITLVLGVLTVVMRIWFTDAQIE